MSRTFFHPLFTQKANEYHGFYTGLTQFALSSDMRKTLSLILPVLIPSWRFFKSIEPSPRVQWALVIASTGTAPNWQEFRPRPKSVSPLQMLCRLFWNPVWNEFLFLVSCAERIHDHPTNHSINEIQHRIRSELVPTPQPSHDTSLQFRLVFVERTDETLSETVVFLSDLFPISNPNPAAPLS